jgi:hypothetical protein
VTLGVNYEAQAARYELVAKRGDADTPLWKARDAGCRVLFACVVCASRARLLACVPPDAPPTRTRRRSSSGA